MKINTIILLLVISITSNPSYAQNQVTFEYTGNVVEWIVPACTYEITIVAAGAQGGGELGGKGATVESNLQVTPGQILQIRIGGQGSHGNQSGGWNGGGSGHMSGDTAVLSSHGGGGATDIRIAPYGLNNRVVVAAGGGGQNGSSPTSNFFRAGGDGGCFSGAQGQAGAGQSGAGGAQNTGGSGGSPYLNGQAGQSGVLGLGGAGGFDTCISTAHGGGGGGGRFGGGGGGSDCIQSTEGVYAGPGGGGSSFPIGNCLSASNEGAGYVTIYWDGTAQQILFPTYPSIVCLGEDIVLSFQDTSVNNIQWWGPNNFYSNASSPVISNNDIDFNSSGTYFVSFDLPDCIDTLNFEITVKDDSPPFFNSLPSHICANYLPNLPLTSDNGVQGYWSPEITQITDSIYLFTPHDYECSSDTFQLSISIEPIIIPDFQLNYTICYGSTIDPFLETSPNGISGQWIPATINPYTTQNYLFTPFADQCGQNISTYVIVLTLTELNMVSSDTLISVVDNLQSYQWELNGELLLGETSFFLVPLQNGIYTVTASDSNGCTTSASTEINTIHVGINHNVNAQFEIYPNPNEGLFKVLSNEILLNEVVLFDVLGKQVASQVCDNFDCDFDIRHLADGVYFSIIQGRIAKMVLKRN